MSICMFLEKPLQKLAIFDGDSDTWIELCLPYYLIITRGY